MEFGVIMSEFQDNEDVNDIESSEQINRRHKKELRDIEGKTRAMIKKAKKKELPKVEAEILKLHNELKTKHTLEIESFNSSSKSEVEVNQEVNEDDTNITTMEDSTNVTIDKEKEAIERKKAKAQRQREKKKEKEKQSELEKEAIRANAGPSMREEELSALNNMLKTEGYQVNEIVSDGHCLYRSLAHQLIITTAVDYEYPIPPDTGVDVPYVRKVISSYLRSNGDEFAPFLALESSTEEYNNYCDDVSSMDKAVWGGQLEVRACSQALSRQIWIYDYQSSIIKIGEEFAGIPLRLTYHRHYYALGEHYNSVISCNDNDK